MKLIEKSRVSEIGVLCNLVFYEIRDLCFILLYRLYGDLMGNKSFSSSSFLLEFFFLNLVKGQILEWSILFSLHNLHFLM